MTYIYHCITTSTVAWTAAKGMSQQVRTVPPDQSNSCYLIVFSIQEKAKAQRWLGDTFIEERLISQSPGRAIDLLSI